MSELNKPAGDVAASPAVVRYAACVQYDGTDFYGWQKLKSGLPTVQQTVEAALSRVANHAVDVVCAGRTDSGVHGANMIIHFDTTAVRKPFNWMMGANSNLPDSISIAWVQPVSSDFHARFKALWRRYRYVILSDVVRPAHLPKGVTWTHQTLDVARMREAAQYLIGEHDFTSYRAVQCQAHSPVREITRLDVVECGNFVVLDVQANGFLHHMIRNIAGVLMSVGSGKREPVWAQEVLDARDRKAGDITAKPHGLYFVAAGYDQGFALPERPLGPWFLNGML